MNTKIIGAIVAILIIGGVGYAATRHMSNTSSSNSTQSNTAQPKTSSSTTSSSTQMSSTSNSSGSTGSTANIAITATDDSASQTTISVTKGTKVNLTFNVSQNGVYHGGLEFKSTDPAIDSGPISTGNSKTVSFVADKSFSFTPYWYASGVKKDYMITVNVQ